MALSLATRAWLAGNFDGEGTVGVTFSSGKLRLRLQVRSTDRKSISVWSKSFSVKVEGPYYPPSHTKQGRRKPIWAFTVSGSSAICVLRALRPYLITKKREATEALKFKPSRRGIHVSAQERSERFRIRERLAELK